VRGRGRESNDPRQRGRGGRRIVRGFAVMRGYGKHFTVSITYLCEGDIKAVGCESERTLTKDHLLTVAREGAFEVTKNESDELKKQRDKRKNESDGLKKQRDKRKKE
jgi:hypothetical protein